MPRIVVLADSDSYVKWGAALAAALDGWDAQLLLVETQLVVNDEQLRAALRDTRIHRAGRVTTRTLSTRLRELAPDAVLVATPGPVMRVLNQLAASLDPRPVVVAGLPGISIPVTVKALRYRRQADLMVVHSHREVREFTALSRARGWDHRMALARLPFAGSANGVTGAGGTDLVFAPQALVPRDRDDRMAVARMLRDAALADPTRRVVVKLRALPGEASTHPEHDAFPELLAELGPRPENLVFASGAMSEALATAGGLVTVSSTALLEAVARGIPAIAIDTFGISDKLINPAFVGSGLFGGRDAVVASAYRHPEPDWLTDNYFHPDADSDWARALEALVAERRAGRLAPRVVQSARGGRLRVAWDRKRAFGSADRTIGGYAALAIGHPARVVVRAWRRARRRLAAVRQATG